MSYESVYYRAENGDEPVRLFRNRLNYKIQQRFFAREEQLLQAFGERLSQPHVKYLGDGLWELKVDFGNLAYRFVYFLHGHFVVHVHAFQKKTQKTPGQELKIACARRKHFYQQLEHGGIDL